MAKPSVINQTTINTTIINGNDHLILIDSAGITLNVNKDIGSVINQPLINSVVINGLITDNNVFVTQTHILSINDCVISLESTSPLPIATFNISPNNANIAVSAKKVFIEKGQGGNLFIKVTEPDATVHRFSFEGIKA